MDDKKRILIVDVPESNYWLSHEEICHLKNLVLFWCYGG